MEPFVPAYGVVPTGERGSRPFWLVYGESLVAAAAFALEAAGVRLLDPYAGLGAAREEGAALVLHDPLCPLAPPEFLAQAVSTAVEREEVVVGVRPVTDTVKEYDGRLLGAGHQRDDLVAVVSPVVLPPAVVAGLDALPEGTFDHVVAALRESWPVHWLAAPATARRVQERHDLVLLEALSGAGR